jgi:hypothetical protein
MLGKVGGVTAGATLDICETLWHVGTIVDEPAVDLGFVASGETPQGGVNVHVACVSFA